MISAAADDLGAPLDLETMDWSSGEGTRRTASSGAPPEVKATLGQPLGWWGPSRPGGSETDRWMIVRFAVSYRLDQGCKVDWSRLTIDLPAAADGTPLIVTDQYPVDVLEEEMRDVQLTVSPQLKLMQVSASLGQVSTTIQIARVTPVVSPWGGQESSFGWDLTSTDQHPITGVRHFFAIIPSPEPALAVSLGVEADAATASGARWWGQRSKPSQQRQFSVALQPWT
jgi:hypothetical protein